MKGKNSKKGKGKSKADERKETLPEGSKEVEVPYADGNWYKGWLSDF